MATDVAHRDTLLSARRAVVDDQADERVIASSRHASELESAAQATALAAVLQGSGPETAEREFEHLVAEAIEAQAAFKRVVWRANRAVLATADMEWRLMEESKAP